IERDLPRDEHEVAVAERLCVRQSGVRRLGRVDDLSLGHLSSYALLPRVAIASSPSTVPSSRTRTYLSYRLIVVSQWLGTSWPPSPARCVPASPAIFPCSSPASLYVASGWSFTLGTPESVLAAFHPASTTSTSGRLTLSTLVRMKTAFSKEG